MTTNNQGDKMSNIASIIEVFRMDEIKPKTRAKLIIKLGTTINNEVGSNLTEPIVVELVKLLDPTNAIFENEHYKHYLEEL